MDRSTVRTVVLRVFGSLVMSAALVVWPAHHAMNQPSSTGTDTVETLRAGREQLIEHFRVHGELNTPLAMELIQRLQAFLAHEAGAQRAPALYELATIVRFLQQWDSAIAIYTEAVTWARKHQETEVEFKSAFGIAKCHANGAKNHGAAAAALQEAIRVAGPHPTRKQRYELASYAAELHEGWGDLDVALVYALEALATADDNADKYFAQLGLGSVFQKYVESCDYRPLVDAKSSADKDDAYGACRRAVAGARAQYEQARHSALTAGWTGLVVQMDGFLSRLEDRRQLLERRIAHERMLRGKQLFRAQRRSEVIVNTDFAGGAESLTDPGVLGPMIAHVTRAAGDSDSRSLYLQGLQADLNRQPDAALSFYRRSVEMLQRERLSMFELRGRSTMIENRIEHVRDLGLRLLARNDLEGAFASFESVRAHGMTVLLNAFAALKLDAQQRASLARLVQLESKESGVLRRLVETAIAGFPHTKSETLLRVLHDTRADRNALLARPDVRSLVEQLKRAPTQGAKLRECEKLVKQTNTAMVLYWVTPVNVVLWTIAPGKTEVRTVFLPEGELHDKVARLRASVQSPNQFDAAAARELYTYLIAPVRDHYSGSQLMLIPQGALLDLPFEALINPATGNYLIQEATVSYAPNATLAKRALTAPPIVLASLRAIYDVDLDAETGEIAGIQRQLGEAVKTTRANDLQPRDALAAMSGARALHLLMHGTFDTDDALQSSLSLNNHASEPDARSLHAGDLIGVDWHATSLVTLSSCEGAQLARRISNEVYGMAWAPLVSGVPRIVLSRWKVQKQSNAVWMASFFSALKKPGTSAARASALAMQALIALPEYAHPYYWAGPQLFGA